MPKISIIIPVYNVQKYLRQCLESVERQTFQNFEAIIVDDGSPDESYKIYQEFAEKDSRFRIVKKENGGVSKARNTGLEHAAGEYVLFIDSDDWMSDDACEILYNKALSSGAELTVADVYIAHENGGNEYVHIFDTEFVSDDAQFIQSYQKAILGYAYNPRPYGGKCTMPTGLGGPWNKLVKRELLDTYGITFDPYLLGMFDDCLYCLNILAHVNKVAYINKPVYYYRMVESSILHGYKKNMLEINSRIFERIEGFIKRSGNEHQYSKAFAFYIVRRFDESLSTYFFAQKNPHGMGDRLSALKKTICTEPYAAAFANVDKSTLHKSRRAICICAEKKTVQGIYLIYILKRIKLMIEK